MLLRMQRANLQAARKLPSEVGCRFDTRHTPAATRGVAGSALEAETVVLDRSSPPELINLKKVELAAVGPAGWSKALVYGAVCLPVWLGGAVRLAAASIKRPSEMFSQPDPSRFKLTPPFPLHEEYLTVNGIKLHAVSPGRQPSKPLMLMLHGFPECWYSWRHQMVVFAQDYDVVALDMRGYNTSDKPQGVAPYMLDVLASDVKGAVEALGHSSCTLVAHDWGGAVAWVTAGMYGRALVERLIVMGSPHMGIWGTNATWQQYQRSLYILLFQAPLLPEKILTRGHASAVRKAFIKQPMGVRNTAAVTEQDLDWFQHNFCQPGVAQAALNYYRAFMRWQLFSNPNHPAWRALKRQLDMPVLVLHGDSDAALGVELLDGIEAAAPDISVNVLKDCSHWVQQDYPGLVNRLMRGWLAGLAAQQQAGAASSH